MQQGFDVKALFREEQNTGNRFLYWEYPHGGLQQAVRWRNWKAFRKGLGGALRLYDLAGDLAEQHDVARAEPKTVARIEAYLETGRTESPYWPTA